MPQERDRSARSPPRRRRSRSRSRSRRRSRSPRRRSPPRDSRRQHSLGRRPPSRHRSPHSGRRRSTSPRRNRPTESRTLWISPNGEQGRNNAGEDVAAEEIEDAACAQSETSEVAERESGELSPDCSDTSLDCSESSLEKADRVEIDADGCSCFDSEESSPSKKSHRSRSPAGRRDANESRSARERPEIREAESSTQPAARENREGSRSRRKSRSPGPGRNRSEGQRRSRSPGARGAPKREHSPAAGDHHKGDPGAVSKKTKATTEDLVLREDISKHTKRRRLMLCDRFTDSDQEAFEADENITIGIERNIRGNSPAVIRREIRPEAVELPRRKDEGAAPLYRREEFRTREGDLTEKRTIKVIEDPVRRDFRSFRSRSRERTQPIVLDRWGDSDRSQVVRREDQFRDRELEERYGYMDSRMLAGHFDDGREGRRLDVEPRDLRYNLTSRRRSDGTDDRRDDMRPDVRSRLGFREREARERDVADFSKRPDKGKFAEWTLNPEQIPKSVRYYEHDNRGEGDYWMPRGRGFRGRRGWRSRGPWRGGRSFGFRGGGGRGYDPVGRRDFSDRDRDRDRSRGSPDRGRFGTSEGEWLHDKFEEIEGGGSDRGEDDNNQPSSTTEVAS